MLGVVLVENIITIRHFFDQQNAQSQMDTHMLRRHNFAFGFSLAATVIAFAAYLSFVSH